MGRGVPAGSHEGPPFKNIDFGSYKLWLDFSRFLTHLVLWNSTDGHSVQDADLTNSIKILLIHRNPQKTSQNEGFRSVALRQSLAGAKWVVASPLDPTRAPPSKTLILGATSFG